MNKSVYYIFLSIILCSPRLYGFQGDDVDIVIYRNFAFVSESMIVEVSSGSGIIEFSDLPGMVQKESIYIENKTGDFVILKQEYDSNIFNSNAFLRGYYGKPIILTLSSDEIIMGNLLAMGGNEVLIQENDNVNVINRSHIRSFTIEGVNNIAPFKPVLRLFTLSSNNVKAGIRLNYITGGVGWSGEYIGVYDIENQKLNLRSWANISNSSGKDINSKKVVLIAGETNQVQGFRKALSADMAMQEARSFAQAPQFQREEAAIYHKYTLNQSLVIGNNKEQKLRLFEEKNIGVIQKFVYDGARSGEKVISSIEFENTESAGIGEPLPRGRIKIFQEDKSGSIYLGEDIISNTPVNKKISITIGVSFDLTGERVQTAYQRLSDRRWEASFKITLKNGSNDNHEVVVLERFSGQWRIIESSQEYVSPDSRTAEFLLNIPAKGEAEITYTVRVN